MNYWTNQLYGHCVQLRSLLTLPDAILIPSKKYWLWQLAYTGLTCDELYSRTIELVSRQILIIPAICIFDKHLSTFMNAQIITNTITALNNKIYRENLSTLDIIRIFVSISISSLLTLQIILLL